MRQPLEVSKSSGPSVKLAGRNTNPQPNTVKSNRLSKARELSERPTLSLTEGTQEVLCSHLHSPQATWGSMLGFRGLKTKSAYLATAESSAGEYWCSEPCAASWASGTWAQEAAGFKAFKGFGPGSVGMLRGGPTGELRPDPQKQHERRSG